MADPPSAPWHLTCPWCAFYIVVNARGAHGNDPGAGVEAAQLMAAHAANAHGRTWAQVLEARC